MSKAVHSPKSTAQSPGNQHVSFTCDQCGKRVGCNTSHYNLIECLCGKTYWALQPDRGGPLVAFPHPGFIVLQGRMAA